MKQNRKIIKFCILLSGLTFLVITFVLRIPRLGFFIFSLFLLLSVFYFDTKKYHDRNSQILSEDETEPEKKIKYCQAQIELNNSEIKEIERNIKELEISFTGFYEASEDNKSNAKKLIFAFERERELRVLKNDFFKACIKKLNALLYNHRMVQQLKDKNEALKKLQEKNHDSIADLEGFKTELEYEQSYLKTIDDLSIRILNTDSLNDVANVKLELEALTQEIKRRK